MKKLIFLCIVLIYGCDKIPSGVVDVTDTNYQIVNLNAPSSFTYAAGDSSIITSLKFNSPANLKEVWAELYGPDNIKINNSPIDLLDDGIAAHGDSTKNDRVFSGKVGLSRTYPNGRYRLEYYVTDISGQTKKVAEHNFNYDNKQQNYPPVLSDLVMPDTIAAGVSFIFAVKATDVNGLKDIKEVTFKFYRSDNSVSEVFNMWDDGNLAVHGDAVAGDGIYSFRNSFLQEIAGQTRIFVFQAIDRSDSISNTITHNIYVK